MEPTPILIVKTNDGEHGGKVWFSPIDNKHHWSCCDSMGENFGLNISLLEMRNHQKRPAKKPANKENNQ